ncbi:MAG: hypothetical protein ACOYMA_08245 [Bacteroidia bacterium]
MKQFLIFIGGFVVGILATILVAFLIFNSKQSKEDLVGLTLFPEKGECITTKKQLVILQVMTPNMALAESGEYPDRITFLLINYENKSYYDDQKIEIPNKKCAKQIGTYQYSTRMGMDKTVPAIVIE